MTRSTLRGSARPAHATEMFDLTRPHAEVIDPTTREVWQTLGPCTREELAALDLPEPYRPIGVGRAAMDETWFDRSPGDDEDGPMREREIAGRRWGHCAKTASRPSRPFGDDGPVEMMVDKHHALRFAAGRRVPVLRTPDGELFHVIDGRAISSIGTDGAPDERLRVPSGCSLGHVALDADWVLRLPAPTRVFFFGSGDSFQGPVDSMPNAWVANEGENE